MPQSQTTDDFMAPRGRDSEQLQPKTIAITESESCTDPES